MGHTTLGDLPSTRKWSQVIDLVRLGAGSSQVAIATTTAAERGLRLAGEDPGLIETVWLLTQLPVAARSRNFVHNLRRLGVQVSDAPGLMDIVGAFSDALDARIGQSSGKTDLGEMAQMAATETLSRVVGGELPNPLEVSPADVKKEFEQLRRYDRIVVFASRFFGRLAHRTLEYFLSRAFADQIGEGERFATLRQKSDFSKELGHHCDAAARPVGGLVAEWIARTIKEKQTLSRDDVAAFVDAAMEMLTTSLKEGALSHGD